MKPGIYQLSNKEYHAVPALSKGTLVSLEKSPAHTKVKSDQTPAMRFGTISHHAVLEPGKFSDRYVVAPVCDKRTKVGKDTWHGFESSLRPDQEIITQEESDTLRAMADAVYAHGQANELLQGGVAEQSVFWTDPTYGFLCKCRPDYLRPSDGLIIDYKTTVDASPKGFAKAVANFKYHYQSVWYLRGVQIVVNPRIDRFIFIAQEKTPPYAVACYEVDHKAFDHAERMIEPLLELYANCEMLDEWPGYSSEIVEISLPNWALYS